MTNVIEIPKRKFVVSQNPPRVGETRVMTWRAEIGASTGADLEAVWQERIAQYWEMQQRLYGYRCTPAKMEFSTVTDEPVPGHPMTIFICSTAVKVTSVLPGERVSRDKWAKWRLANPNVE